MKVSDNHQEELGGDMDYGLEVSTFRRGTTFRKSYTNDEVYNYQPESRPMGYGNYAYPLYSQYQPPYQPDQSIVKQSLQDSRVYEDYTSPNRTIRDRARETIIH